MFGEDDWKFLNQWLEPEKSPPQVSSSETIGETCVQECWQPEFRDGTEQGIQARAADPFAENLEGQPRDTGAVVHGFGIN